MSDNTDLRDRLAVLCGYVHETGCWTEWEDDRSYVSFTERWVCGDRVVYFHPFPDGDLNALAAVWPEKLRLRLFYDSDEHIGYEWIVQARRHGVNEQRSGSTEYDARLRLTVAVLERKA